MVKNRHILFIVENNPVPDDRRVWKEALAARELGFDVSVICPSSRNRRDDRTVIGGIRIYRHPRPLEGSGKLSTLAEYANALLWELLLSIRIYASRPFQVIVSANPPDHVFLVAAPFKLAGVKYIFDHHDLTPETYVAKYGAQGLVYRVLLWMERLTFRAADIVISTNESYRTVANVRGGKKLEDIYVVRNGPDLPSIPEVRSNRDLLAGFRYLVGYVGVIGRQEGIENLLRAAEYLTREKGRTDILFAVVGSGPHLKTLMREAKGMGLERNVRFFGYLPDHEFYEILQTSDVCINPEFGNAFTDKSTMIKIMDYMTFGKPIVQFHTVEGEVTAGDSAVFIRENDIRRFADAILELLDDPDRRERMGRSGRARIVEKWNWEIQKQNLLAVYRRIMA